jgi:catechol 2,3-dioxygenase-like lactoylglutathione lyase family enzyme
MTTIDHVTLRVADLAAARALFDQVFDLVELGADRHQAGGFDEWGDFSIAEADSERPPTTGLHIAFTAASHERVDAWWQTLTAAGYQSDGPPGLRPQYSPDYYGAFILDHHGNSVEAVTHGRARARPAGLIDHLWIRVPNLDAIRSFYTPVAAAANIGARDQPDRFRLIPEIGSITFLEGPPTRNLHLAFGVDDAQTVQSFHDAAIAAGGRDNGPPGERPEYHPGYYGAFAIDPAGSNVEAVYHDRSGRPTRVD